MFSVTFEHSSPPFYIHSSPQSVVCICRIMNISFILLCWLVWLWVGKYLEEKKDKGERKYHILEKSSHWLVKKSFAQACIMIYMTFPPAADLFYASTYAQLGFPLPVRERDSSASSLLACFYGLWKTPSSWEDGANRYIELCTKKNSVEHTNSRTSSRSAQFMICVACSLTHQLFSLTFYDANTEM